MLGLPTDLLLPLLVLDPGLLLLPGQFCVFILSPTN